MKRTAILLLLAFIGGVQGRCCVQLPMLDPHRISQLGSHVGPSIDLRSVKLFFFRQIHPLADGEYSRSMQQYLTTTRPWRGVICGPDPFSLPETSNIFESLLVVVSKFRNHFFIT